jgi:hypothetical protein
VGKSGLLYGQGCAKIQGWKHVIFIQEVILMATVAVSFIGYVVKAVIFAVIAFAGIMCGKKLRDKNDAKKAAQSQESIR